jgi:hypothetical protein
LFYTYNISMEKETLKVKQQVTVVGALHIGLSLLTFLAGVIVAMVLIGTGLLVAPTQGGEEALPILLAVGLGVGLLLVVLSVPGIVGGWGLLKFKSWARILVIILSAIDLLNVPIGTVVGGYSLWVLLQDETEKLFAGDDLA